MDKAMNELSQQIKHWGLELGFQQVGITDTDFHQAEQRLLCFPIQPKPAFSAMAFWCLPKKK
jgi:epoxyqueuosine reductase QueG